MTDAASAFIDELQRPLRLARDVERGLLGDILGRLDWPTRRYPMLAAWTEQWSRPADDPQNSVPLVHARHPAPITTTTIHHVDVHPVTMRRAADPRPAPPLVQAKRPAPHTSSPTTQPTKSSTPPPKSSATPAPATSSAPPIEPRPARTTEPARPVSLPRVVSAFRLDLSARPAEPVHTRTIVHEHHEHHAPTTSPHETTPERPPAPPTAPREPAASAAPVTASIATPPTVTARQPVDTTEPPLVHPAPAAHHVTTAHVTSAHHTTSTAHHTTSTAHHTTSTAHHTTSTAHREPSTAHREPSTAHREPSTATPRHEPARLPAELPRISVTQPATHDIPLVHIDAATHPAATPSQPHAPPPSPPAHAHPTSTSTATRPVIAARIDATATATDPRTTELSHPAAPEAPRPPRPLASQSPPITRARTHRPSPPIPARWVADGDAPPLHRPPPARAQRVELSHAVASPTSTIQPGVPLRPVSEDSPSSTFTRTTASPTATPASPSSSPSPSSPSVDVDAVVDTTLRRLGRELERARGRRRAIR